MTKITNFKDLKVEYPNRYKVTEQDGSSKLKTITFEPGEIYQEGTKESAEVFNNINKNCIYRVDGIFTTEGQEEIYDINIQGIEDFEFENLQILVNPSSSNTKESVFIRLNGQKYVVRHNLATVKANDILTGESLLVSLDFQKKNADIIGVLKGELDKKLDKTAIVNDLTTGGTDKALSGQMGVELKEQIDNKLDKGTYNGNAQDLKNDIDKKEPKITRSNATNSSSTTDVATSKAVKDTFDRTTANMGTTQNGNFPLTSATVGNTYRATNGKLYKCIKAYSGTSISVPNANFEELSIYNNYNRYIESSDTTGTNSNGTWTKNGVTGEIMQWGNSGTYSNGQIKTIILPTAFKDTNYVVIPINTGTTTNNYYSYQPHAFTTTSFKIRCQDAAGSSGGNVRWIAVGK